MLIRVFKFKNTKIFNSEQWLFNSVAPVRCRKQLAFLSGAEHGVQLKKINILRNYRPTGATMYGRVIIGQKRKD
jgi:hypothetical protein